MIAGALLATAATPVVPARPVAAAGEAGNAAPAAVGDSLVLPADGATVTLHGLDTDGDTLTFSVGDLTSNVDLGVPTPPTCSEVTEGNLCSVVVDVTPTSSSGYFTTSGLACSLGRPTSRRPGVARPPGSMRRRRSPNASPRSRDRAEQRRGRQLGRR